MKLEPNQFDYTVAMLPGLIGGAIVYWVVLFPFLVTLALSGGQSIGAALTLILSLGAGMILMSVCSLFIGLILCPICCLVNWSLGKPLGSTQLAICVGGLTYFLLTAWISIMAREADLIPALLGPVLATICGSTMSFVYQRYQQLYIPSPKSNFQFNIRNFFALTFWAAVLILATQGFTNRHLAICLCGYGILQLIILVVLSWIPIREFDSFQQQIAPHPNDGHTDDAASI